MKVGDVVKVELGNDKSYKGIIMSVLPTWKETDWIEHKWDFEIMSEHGDMIFVDKDEVTLVYELSSNNEQRE